LSLFKALEPNIETGERIRIGRQGMDCNREVMDQEAETETYSSKLLQRPQKITTSLLQRIGHIILSHNSLPNLKTLGVKCLMDGSIHVVFAQGNGSVGCILDLLA
jgi:hypothetical protein